MKYTNWQELHKKAYSRRARQGPTNKKAPPSIEEIHLRAWARLQRLCSMQELDRLKRLAFLYDHGFKKNDTIFN
jgi:hypothetical protein